MGRARVSVDGENARESKDRNNSSKYAPNDDDDEAGNRGGNIATTTSRSWRESPYSARVTPEQLASADAAQVERRDPIPTSQEEMAIAASALAAKADRGEELDPELETSIAVCDKAKRFKPRLRKKGFLIDPRRGRFMPIWDIATTLCLLYTALITPYEVAFLEPPATWAEASGDVLFILNRLVDVIFVADIAIQFVLMYQHDDPINGITWIDDPGAIAANYLRGWFPYDVMTCIPFDLVVGGFAAASGTSLDGILGPNVLRIFKFLRFMKLTRVFRISRIIHRWQDHIGFSYTFITNARFVLAVLMLAGLCSARGQ